MFLSLSLSLKKKMLFTSADLIDEGKGLKIISLSRFFMEKNSIVMLNSLLPLLR